MLPNARKHASTIAVAMLTAALTAGAPAIADGVRHALFAHRAGKVDGLSAVKSKASLAKRRGKLVATNPRTGRLPNNIIRKAPNSQLLDGLDSLDFLRADGVASDSQLLDGIDSSSFMTRTGIVLVQGNYSDYREQVGSGTVDIARGVAQTTLTSTSASGNASLFLIPEFPTALYGRTLAIAGVEVCYDASANFVLSQVDWIRTANTTGSAASTTQAMDTTDRTDEACRVYTPTTTTLPTETTVALQLQTTWDANGALMRLGRVTFMLDPTATAAVPIAGP